ncbi:MAG: RNHCP domain-containing protein [Deltaproteobacteria bacterium]|nr:RNHCP domain-containing protein [Deltaproteobacteria bacterium]
MFSACKEDFTCFRCAKVVKGNGYTNHCPQCLWSKHVDNNPGDRASNCGGEMEPVAIEKRGKQMAILHRCQTCGFERRNKTASADSFEAVIEVLSSSARRCP